MIGDEVRRARGKRTIASFAKLLETQSSTISYIERGIREPSKTLARKLSILTGVPVDKYLYND